MSEPQAITPPTPEEIRDFCMEEYEGDQPPFEKVHQHADPSWRHGCYMDTVYKRLSDGTFWSVSWQRSGDGEYNSIRDGGLGQGDIVQVWPKAVPTVEYTGERPADA